MATSSDPLNNPGFAVPSLQAYQAQLRAQLGQQATQQSGGMVYAGLMAQGAFDLARSLGHLTPQEKIIGRANLIQQEANETATATDPAERRLQALSRMVQRFNEAGLSDMAAQAMPELVALQQRKIEMQKLRAEAGSAETKATVDAATADSVIEDRVLQPLKTTADIAATKASTTRTNLEIDEKRNEGQNYTKDGQIVTVAKTNTAGRAALERAGWALANPVQFSPQHAGDMAATKPTQTDLQKVLTDGFKQLDTVGAALSKYDPSFLTRFHQAKFATFTEAERLGVPLNASQAADLQQYNDFRTDVLNNLNAGIRAITGATMGIQEANERLIPSMPNMKDGNTQFMSHVRESVRLTLGSMKRAQTFLDRGVGPPLKEDGTPDWDRVTMPPVSDAEVDTFLRTRLRLGAPVNSSPGTTTASPPDADGWQTMPNGVRVREKR